MSDRKWWEDEIVDQAGQDKWEENLVRNSTGEESVSIMNDGDYDADFKVAQKRKQEAQEDRDTSVSSDQQQNNRAGDEAEASILKAKSIAELMAHIQSGDYGTIHPALERRVRDFRFAQDKRREKYGNERPWGILGLYDHLASIRTDLEWAEDAAWRRQHDEPYLSWMDYDEARKIGVNRPFFTYAFMVICTVMMFTSIGVNGWKFEALSVNPMIGPSADTLLKMGAKQTSLIVDDGEWFRIFSPVVLHAGLIHYFLNMIALWFIGSAVEMSHGFINCTIIFIIPAVGGNIMSALFLPQYISVGASGGIFGLIGACLADIVINWNLLFLKTSASDESNAKRVWVVLLWLLFDIFINCVIGLTPFVDNFTHLGGMIYGFLCGLSTMEQLSLGFFGLRTGRCAQLKNGLIKFFGLIVSVILIMVTTALLAGRSENKSPCSSCRYVSCVPMPFWSEEKWWYCDDCNFVMADAIREPQDSIYYTSLALTCPDGQVETFNVLEDGVSERDEIRKRLPAYCREHCDSVFAS
mmetsp:Transcript_12840/g.18211  ORF Transcript_12840/g.18211 Transcript_12840/m.18211 type:complete len:525 (-) Transcript_12840:134-1708(-)